MWFNRPQFFLILEERKYLIFDNLVMLRTLSGYGLTRGSSVLFLTGLVAIKQAARVDGARI